MPPTERPPRRSLLGGRRPPPRPQPLEDDPLAHAFPMRRGLPAFVFSAAFHAALLVLLATISFAVVHRDERINVKLREDIASDLDDSQGAPSLHEIAGSLHPVTTAPRAAGSVTGPSTAPAVASVRAPEMPRIAGIGPSIGQSPGTLDVPLSVGGGGLAGGSIGGGGFGDVLGGLRKVGIDLVLVIDTTDSMQSVLEDVKREVRAFIGDLQQMVPASRVAVVAYRDKGDEYVTKVLPLTSDLDKVYTTLMDYRADGGGDTPEDVRRALAEGVAQAGWAKDATQLQHTAQILFLVGDAPPHMDYSGAPKYPEVCQKAMKRLSGDQLHACARPNSSS